MNNNELSAETAAEKTKKAEVTTSSHTIGKPHVGSSFSSLGNEAILSTERLSKPITGLVSTKLDYNELGTVTLFKKSNLSNPKYSQIQMFKTNTDYLFDLLFAEYLKDQNNPNIKPVSTCEEMFS
jgi:hypothetical protein